MKKKIVFNEAAEKVAKKIVSQKEAAEKVASV